MTRFKTLHLYFQWIWTFPKYEETFVVQELYDFWWITFVWKMHWYMLQCYCSLSGPFSMCRLDLIYFWGWFVGFCCTSSIFYLSTCLPTFFISRLVCPHFFISQLVCPAPRPPLLILRHGSDVTPSSADTTEATNGEWRSKQSLPSWKLKDIH